MAVPRQAQRGWVAAASVGGELDARPARILSDLAGSQADPSYRLLDDFVQSLSSRDVHSLLGELDGIMSGESRDEVRLVLLARLAEMQPPEAASLAHGLAGGALRDQAMRLVMESWVQMDPEAATNWLQEISEPERDRLMDRAISTWASADYDNALNWARDSANGAVKERALIHLSSRWLEADPRQALGFAQDLQSASHQLVSTLASQWAARDPKAAAEWAVQLPEGPQRAKVIASLTAAWAQHSPREAAAFAASLAGGEVQTDAVVSAISGWARRDPQEAAQWVAIFPDDDMRALAVVHLVPPWSQRDPASAAEWLITMPDGRGKDLAFDSFSAAMTDRYPAIAFTFAQSISDEVLRRDRINFVARQWLATNPEAATADILKANLPDDFVARLVGNASLSNP